MRLTKPEIIDTSSFARFSYCGVAFARFTLYGNPVYMIEMTKSISTAHGVDIEIVVFMQNLSPGEIPQVTSPAEILMHNN